MIRVSKNPKEVSPFSNPVLGGVDATRAETEPISVAPPVPTTTTVPLPLATWVPKNTMLVRAFSSVSVALVPGFFSTGKVSPVRLDSSSCRPFDASTMASPGTRSPAESWATSPGTIDVIGTCCTVPSRVTLTRTSTTESRAAIARPAPRSWKKPSNPEMVRITKMITESIASPSTQARIVAATRIRTIGLRN